MENVEIYFDDENDFHTSNKYERRTTDELIFVSTTISTPAKRKFNGSFEEE